LVRKLVQVYPIGDEICASSAFTHPNPLGKPGYCVTINVRELDEWKIRMEYWKMIDDTLIGSSWRSWHVRGDPAPKPYRGLVF